ncbi:unnamed protein product [Fusarium graminearum]|nr:unnamed protein product [Fusarium graminearum]
MHLSQHAKDLDLLKRIADSLECGIVRKHKSREAVELVITKSEDINQKLTPLLSKHTLSGVKLLDFERFKKASILINSKAHLTSEGAVLLMSTNDLVSIFLAIELQSYGLYILSTLYRNSELSTTGGLIYFFLGGLSSCFILLGTIIFTIGFLFKGTPKASGTKPYMKMYEWLN